MSEKKEKKRNGEKIEQFENLCVNDDMAQEEIDEMNEMDESYSIYMKEEAIYREICDILEFFRDYIDGEGLPLGEYVNYNDIYEYVFN